MSKEIKNITDDVMEKIRGGELKMKPKYYFVLGSIFSFVGLILSLTTSVFLIALIRFVIRSNGGMMAEYRFDQMVSSFPWWAPVLAIISFFIGIRLIRRYDFSYKKNFVYVVIWLLLAVFATAFIFDITGLNEAWLRGGPMKGIMKQYFRENNGISVNFKHKNMQANLIGHKIF